MTGGPAAAAGSTAGPPDLAHAIQAAAGALQLIYDWEDYDVIVLRAAAPVLLQATRDRLADLEGLLRRMFEQRGGQIEDNGLDDWDPNYKWWIKDTPLYAEVRAALDGPAAQEEGGGG